MFHDITSQSCNTSYSHIWFAYRSKFHILSLNEITALQMRTPISPELTLRAVNGRKSETLWWLRSHFATSSPPRHSEEEMNVKGVPTEPSVCWHYITLSDLEATKSFKDSVFVRFYGECKLGPVASPVVLQGDRISMWSRVMVSSGSLFRKFICTCPPWGDLDDRTTEQRLTEVNPGEDLRWLSSLSLCQS